MITLNNVGKEFRRGRWGVRGVSFTIHKGEFVILSGPSGAGKTTLLKLLSFEHRPTSGDLALEGRSSASIRKRELPHVRRRIGLGTNADRKTMTEFMHSAARAGRNIQLRETENAMRNLAAARAEQPEKESA